MCGIIAITGKDANKTSDQKVEAMLVCLAMRGPNDRGFDRFDDIDSISTILGQTRLSIVDLSPAGHQPMQDNTRSITVVFNGEIYGYKDVRKTLETRGHRFSTNSDTEVILKAYTEYGKKCVDHLDGMFAFAIWDNKKKELFIARDRFGKKPFYYAFHNETFFAASEIKSIFATDFIKGKIDLGALDDYLRLLYIPPYKTIYSNIHTLPPAHAGIVKNGKLDMWRYWNLEKKKIEVTYDNAKIEIRRLFDEAVKKRMVADVEIGSLLSGGIDSTIVTAYAQKYSTFPIKTFAVGYGDYQSELPFAKIASEKIGTDHYTLIADKGDVGELRKVIEYFDEPHADSSDFPQALVSKLAASKVKVALSGDGADELFMGYGWYQKYWHTPRWKRIFKNPFSSYKETTEIFTKKERDRLLKTHGTSDTSFEKAVISRFSNPFEKINAFDLSVYLPGQLLTKVDRTGMMHSLEVRSPFLDTALAEYVYNLPLKFKLSRSENKIILKDILTEIFPKDFVYRKKQGFGAPIQDWMKEEGIKKEITKLLSNEIHPLYKYINKNVVRDIFDDIGILNKSSIQKAWSLLCLGIWFELHNKYISDR